MLSEMWSKATVTRTIRRLDFMVHGEHGHYDSEADPMAQFT